MVLFIIDFIIGLIKCACHKIKSKSNSVEILQPQTPIIPHLSIDETITHNNETNLPETHIHMTFKP